MASIYYVVPNRCHYFIIADVLFVILINRSQDVGNQTWSIESPTFSRIPNVIPRFLNIINRNQCGLQMFATFPLTSPSAQDSQGLQGHSRPRSAAGSKIWGVEKNSLWNLILTELGIEQKCGCDGDTWIRICFIVCLRVVLLNSHGHIPESENCRNPPWCCMWVEYHCDRWQDMTSLWCPSLDSVDIPHIFCWWDCGSHYPNIKLHYFGPIFGPPKCRDPIW